jgi:hypothetical protein
VYQFITGSGFMLSHWRWCRRLAGASTKHCACEHNNKYHFHFASSLFEE